MNSPLSNSTPLVSVIMPTRNRPRFLEIALACYAHQTYPARELIVIDDGDEPANQEAVERVGGRLLRMGTAMSLGNKLNYGITHARGTLVQRMDDDDYYAPEFMNRMVECINAQRTHVCRPFIAGMTDQIFFDVRRWEMRRSPRAPVGGPTFLFYHADWIESPFRPILKAEDLWLTMDLWEVAGKETSIPAGEDFLQVRHGSHTWRRDRNDMLVEDRIQLLPMHQRSPDVILPAWAVEEYRLIQHDLLHEDRQ